MNEFLTEPPLLDFEPANDTFLADVLSGLQSTPRFLPCKYFYDATGSMLFEQICELDEYYLTRTELQLMEDYGPEMAEQIGEGVMLVEFGSGSSHKTRILLDHLQKPIAYVPVDISRDHLFLTSKKLSKLYPEIEVLPVCADFTQDFELPEPKRRATHSAVYFPGSTIGNLLPGDACKLLRRIADFCGRGGGLLIGVDLQKESSIVEAAYNDSKGVTAEFNLNLLHRINRELEGDFVVERFRHAAVYDEEHGRVEISAVSMDKQVVSVSGESFDFEAGDVIRTEFSHKYTVEGFAGLAAEAGLTLGKHWIDDDGLFAIIHLVVA